MIDHIVTARSMESIRQEVNGLKRMFELENTIRFPLIYFYENIVPELFSDYRFMYVCSKDLNGEEAYTDHAKKVVKIRVDVYEAALKGSARDLFTIAHEIGHLFLHREENLTFTRTMKRFPAYKSAEWQANYFAAELLMPSHLIVGMSIEEIVEYCGVSKKAASIQLTHATDEYYKGKI